MPGDDLNARVGDNVAVRNEDEVGMLATVNNLDPTSGTIVATVTGFDWRQSKIHPADFPIKDVLGTQLAISQDEIEACYHPGW